MGTLAAGIKEIFATAKTTGSNVMLCGNDGTPDGHMTMANLASVLGAMPSFNNTDPDKTFTRGVYACAPTINGSIYYGLLIVFESYGFISQVLYSANSAFFRRNKEQQHPEMGFNNWQRIDNFGCLDLPSLANALGGELHSIQSNTYIVLELHGSENASEATLQFYSGTTRLGEFNIKKASGRLEWYNAITGTLTTLAQ